MRRASSTSTSGTRRRTGWPWRPGSGTDRRWRCRGSSTRSSGSTCGRRSSSRAGAWSSILAPSGAFSRHTLDLLVEAGLDYDASLAGHDIPYVVTNGRDTVVELPHDAVMDDWTQYMCSREFGYMLPIASPQRAMEVFRAEFDAAWRHGALWNAVWHPFVSGRLSRCDAMMELVEY